MVVSGIKVLILADFQRLHTLIGQNYVTNDNCDVTWNLNM